MKLKITKHDLPGIGGETFELKVTKGFDLVENMLIKLYEEHYVLELFDKLFEDIKHGDQEHQDWLKNKIEDFKKTL